MSYAARKKDSNQSEITSDLEDVGVLVIDTSMVPGFVDMVVGFRGEWHLLEAKGVVKKLRGRKQRTFHAICEAMGLPVDIVNNSEDALKAIGAVDLNRAEKGKKRGVTNRNDE